MAKAKVTEELPNPLAVGRHTGENIWGYEVLEDGSIRLSPGFADRMREVLDRENGIYGVQEGIARFVASELEKTAMQRRLWWNTLGKDLGIDITKNSGWMFHIDGVVTPPAPKEEPTAE